MSDLSNRVRALRTGPFPAPPPGLADAALHRARRRSARHRAGAVAGVAALAAVLVVTVNVMTGTLSSTSKPTPATTTGLFAQPRQNVLLLGVDSGPGRVGTRPDTIILASVDTKSAATTLFSFPRNLGHVPFNPDSVASRIWPKGFTCPQTARATGIRHDDCMLNGIWEWAETSKDYNDRPDPGLIATARAVEGISGLKVDQTVVVKMQGLVDLVDAVGGVRVDVDQRLPRGGHPEATPDQGDYYTEATQGYLEPGRDKLLNGYNALWFARSRRTTDDYDRMRRQRCLVEALVQQAGAATLATHWRQIVTAVGKNLTTSIPLDELGDWVELAGRMKSAPMRSVVFDGQRLGDPSNPDYDAIRATIADTLAAPGSDAGSAGSSSGSSSGSSAGSSSGGKAC